MASSRTPQVRQRAQYVQRAPTRPLAAPAAPIVRAIWALPGPTAARVHSVLLARSKKLMAARPATNAQPALHRHLEARSFGNMSAALDWQGETAQEMAAMRDCRTDKSADSREIAVAVHFVHRFTLGLCSQTTVLCTLCLHRAKPLADTTP